VPLSPGAIVASRYRVARRIGAGGMGEVWAGEHLGMGAPVAVKTLLPSSAQDPQIVARFRREASLLGRLRSERVARVLDFVEDPVAGLALVMEYVDGEPLGAVLARGRLSVDEALEVGVDLAGALCDLHRAKVVHRDLKPDNVILAPSLGDRRRAVLVDLGVGRVDAAPGVDDAVSSITEADTAVGTLPYMAPEQLLHSASASAAADVYALGAILYRALSGEAVFSDADDGVAARRKLVDDAPPLSIPRIDRVAAGLSAVVARALRREPEDRPTAEQLLAELTALADTSRALALDLDAPTEQVLPIGVSALASSEAAPARHVTSRPTEPPSTEPVGSLAEDTARDPSRTDFPSVSLAKGEAPPASTPPSVDVVVSTARAHGSPKKRLEIAKTLPQGPGGLAADAVADALTRSAIHKTLPTVHSAMPAVRPYESPAMVPLPRDAAVAFPSSLDPSSRPSSQPPPAHAGRVVPFRLAVMGVLAALIVGTVAGFAARDALGPPARSAPR
jgi:serine/threonine-protein kinase